VPLAEKTENQLDDQILPIIQKSLKIVIWIIAIVVGLNNAGYNVGTLLAGLGIGGLAFAMAAKDSVSNLFGGITVLMDKPFKVGDRIIVGGFDGNVVEIGMRSTRLKTLAGRIVTIPNKIFTDSNIENVTSEPSRRIVLKLSLVYGTTPEKMEEAVLILENINLKSENTEQVTSISFDSFSSYSLDITFIYFIIKEKDVYKTQTEINTKILKEFEQNGLEFAFPTQIIYSK
jgi:MscS family membrane protein